MGQGFSQDNGIWVQTDKPSYYEGEVVHGHIYLNCISQFKCRGLHISIQGEERTRWVERRTHNRTRADGTSYTETERIPHRGYNEFFNVRVQVFNFGGQVQPGQYAFPFQFTIPPGMPGIFEAESTQDTEAMIMYSIVSECDVKGIFNRDIRHRQNLVVLQRMMNPITNIRTECTQSVTKCCCCKEGDARLTAHLDKSAYVPGETVQILCEITNDSPQKFEKVKVELVRSMTIRSNTGRSHTTRDIVAVNQYRGIGANESRTGSNPLSLPLQLGTNIYASVSGQLIHCEYYVDVVFVANNIIVGNLDVKIPVVVYAPQPPPTVFIQQLPAGFTPQYMGETMVNLPQPSAPMMPQAPSGGQYAQAAPQPMPVIQQPSMSEKAPLLGNQSTGAYGASAPPAQYAQGQPQQQYGQPQQQYAPQYGQ
eukprot:m.1625578 g.1625578  ORF g.1625578 m.1625578 type:complete len:423 (+) comp25394_c0_seq1:82-1350(+)